MTNRLLPSLLAAAGLAAASSSAAADTTGAYTFNALTHIGAAGTAMSSDGWVANNNQASWTTRAFGADTLAGLGVNTDSTAIRNNDGEFSFTIPNDTTRLIMDFNVRTGTGFWQAGISSGGASLLGVGADFGTGDKYFLLDNGTRRSEVGANATGDAMHVLRLDFNVATGKADLILDPSGINSLLMNQQTMSATLATLGTENQIFFRTSAATTGLRDLTITTVSAVPEPSTYGLLGAGALAAVAFVRRRRKAIDVA